MRSRLLLLSILACPTLAAADTLDVPADFATLQEAVDAALSGDRIRVAKGTYAGFVLEGKSDITIEGKGKPVLDGAGAPGAIVTLSEAGGIELDGLIVRDSGERGVLIADCSDITLRRCTIEDVGSDGIRAWGTSGLLIEKCTVQDTGDGIDLSPEDSSGASNGAIIRKNDFVRNESGIDIAGNGHFIEKNHFDDIVDVAVFLDEDTTSVTISKNTIDNPESAMLLRGSGHVVEKNKVKSTRNEGITVEASDCRIEKNKIDRVDDDAIDVEGDDNQILKNRIKRSNDNGIELDPADGKPFAVTGNLLEKNDIRQSDGHGVFIGATVAGNTFVKNKASKSDGFDLMSEAAEDSNTFEGNQFGTTQFP